MLKSFIIFFLFISSIFHSVDAASVRICNDGAYLAQCYFHSQTLSFIRRTRYYETGLFPVAQCRSMEIPIDSVLNRLECKSLAFIAVYKSIFVQFFATTGFDFCYRITGTTLIPRWTQEQC